MSFKSLYPSQKQAVLSVQSLTVKEKDLLNIHVGVEKGAECLLDSFSISHKYHYIDRYQSLQTKCCDSFHKHTKPIRNKSLRQVTLDNYCSIKSNSKMAKLNVVQGKKLCANLNLKIQKKLQETNASSQSSALSEGASS